MTKLHSDLCKNDINAQGKVVSQLGHHYFYCPGKVWPPGLTLK